jgi:DNA-binding NarL/FixJ family response regulator
MPSNQHSPDGQLRSYTYEAVSDALEAERRRLASRLQETIISQANLVQQQVKAYELSADGQSRMAFSVLSALVQQLLQRSYDLENSLNPSVLETLGLAPALESFANQQRRSLGVNISLSLAKLRERLPSEIELSLFRTSQDAIERAIRDAQATQILIQLEYNQDTLHYVISDNGIGRSEDILRSAQERIAALGGTIEFGKSRFGGLEMRISFYFETPIELTEREMDVIQLLAEGHTNKEIALSLDVRPRTVKFHLDNIYSKLAVSTRTEAAIYALRHGWVNKNQAD